MDSRDREAACGKWYDKFDQQNMTLSITTYNDDDEEEDMEFPAIWEVCGLCDGNGSHTNPSVDFNGITREDFDRDPQFEEEYFKGAYDVPCYRCAGRTTEPAVDTERLTEEQQKALNDHLEALNDDFATEEAERRAGC